MVGQSTLPQIWAAVSVLCRVGTAVHAWCSLIRIHRIRSAETLADRAIAAELAQGRPLNVTFLLKTEAHESVET
jgi:hypothetical protein